MEDMYESEHTKFMREMLEKNPELTEKRLAARAIWWDRKLNLEEQKRFKESKEPQKRYVFFSGS